MLKILITGKDSYIGTSFENLVYKISKDYQIDTIDVRSESWRKVDFSKYRAIINVAGITHRNPKKTDESLYYKVNRDLAIDLAKKAKLEGVKQFIQMSSMAVYGIDSQIGKAVIIDRNTHCNPQSAYGKSKLEADEILQGLECDKFKVTIVRPPMVYGPNCVGNYVLLSKITKKLRVFPRVGNKRSMVYIDHLSQALLDTIIEGVSGSIHPQDINYVNTSEMVRYIGEANNIKVIESGLAGWIIKVLGNRNRTLQKVAGNLTYAKDIDDLKINYSGQKAFRECVYKCEGK